MDQNQIELAQDGGLLMRHIVMGRWDNKFRSGNYRMTTEPQFSRRFIACTTSNQDGSSFVAKVVIPAQELSFFNYKAGDGMTDAVAGTYTTDKTDTSLATTPKQLNPGVEMVVESFDFLGGPVLPKWASAPFGFAAGDAAYDPYGTLIAVEIASGRALQDVILNAFLSEALLKYTYADGGNGSTILGPGCKALGGLPHNVQGGRIKIPEGLFWGSNNDITECGATTESQLTLVAQTTRPIYLAASFGSAARLTTNLSVSVMCIANGLKFERTARSN